MTLHQTTIRLAMRLAACGVALLLLLTSCETDSYDKGEGEYSLLRADFVEAHTDAQSRVDYVLTDDGDSLPLAKPFTSQQLTTPDSVYRALIYYNKVENRADPVSFALVPVARIRPLSDFSDGVKTDPVKFESGWVSTSRRYLNLGLVLMNGQPDADDARHVLGVVGDTIVQHADSTRTYHLRLYHDQGGVPQYYSQRTYFSIPLPPYDVDSMRIVVETYGQPVDKTYCVK